MRHPRWSLTGKATVAVVSMMVFGVTGIGWFQVRQLTGGLAAADVIDPGAQHLSAQNILLVGLDSRTDAHGNPLPTRVLARLHAGGAKDGGDTTDTMIVIHIPAGGGKATGFSIPRDSYVPLAGGFGTHKINSAYSRSKAAALHRLRANGLSGPRLQRKAAATAAKTTIHTVEHLTGLTINHYAAINLAGFYYISKAVGGVPVCLKHPVHDTYSGADFRAGRQRLSGAAALKFVRQRHGLPRGDLDRIKRQQAFMASMAHTVLSTGMLTNPTKLNALISAIQKTVVLDKGWNVLAFARQLQGLSAGNITFRTIPVEDISLPTPQDGTAVKVSRAEVQHFVRQLIHPQRPKPTPASTAPSPRAQTHRANSSITVTVRNANGTDGLAAAVQHTLIREGFQPGGVGNAAHQAATTVHYARGERQSATRVAAALGKRAILMLDSTEPTGTILVELGTTYHGPPEAAPDHHAAASGGRGGSTRPSQNSPAPITASGGPPCVN